MATPRVTGKRVPSSHLTVFQIALVACAAAAFGGLLGGTFGSFYSSGTNQTYGIDEATPSAFVETFEGCNVLGLQVHGTILATRSQVPVTDFVSSGDGYGTLLTPNYTISNQAVDILDWAATDENIKAVIVDIDSPGGTSAAGNELAQAVRRFGKPSAAVIHDLGVSSGYLVAAASNRVFAGLSSTVGSIGATYSYLNMSEKNKEEGVVYEALSSGPYKDMMSPDKPLSDEERALIERDLKILHDDFVGTVAVYRELPRQHIERLADGSALLGGQALNEGLVDEIGGIAEASMFISQMIGEPISICWQ